jgi:hypothetical protein
MWKLLSQVFFVQPGSDEITREERFGRCSYLWPVHGQIIDSKLFQLWITVGRECCDVGMSMLNERRSWKTNNMNNSGPVNPSVRLDERNRGFHKRRQRMYFPIQTLHIVKVGVTIGVLFSIPMTSLGMTQVITTPPPVSGHELSVQSITPADVFARAQLVRKELDDIRFEMGQPKSREVGLLVEDATPHEVFFQAKTLNQKVARLITELTEELEPIERKEDPADIRPFHVWKMIDTSLSQILSLKQQLGLPLTNSEALADVETTPNHVFFIIGLANTQLNLLLMHQFSPRDAAELVSLGIEYTTHLLRQFPTGPSRAPLPPLERGRKSWNSYDHLIDCYMVLGRIARDSNIQMLTLASQNLDRPDIQSNDVYDLATLVISELAYLHAHLPHTPPPQPVRLHGPILPSHVYQQVDGLLAQLQILQRQVQSHPEWMP